MIPTTLIEDFANGNLKSNFGDIIKQHSKNKFIPPDDEYWVVRNDEVIFKTKDGNEADHYAADNNGISIRPNGKSFYIFGKI